MQYKKIGNTDMKVSSVALGTWAIGGVFWGGTNMQDSENAIRASLDAGINFIDTAPAYGFGLAESVVGRIIKKRRDSVIIATKCGLVWDKQGGSFHYKFPLPDGKGFKDVYRNLTKESINEEIKQSLERLQTDYIDIYITHWPDPVTPVQETMESLINLKEKGYIRAIGISNASLETLKEFCSSGVIDVDQENYSLIDRSVEVEVLPWCASRNISMLAYGSIAQGLLTGEINPARKFTSDDARLLFNKKRFEPDNIIYINNLLEKFLQPIASKYNCSIGNVAIAAIIQNNNVIALCGARNEKQAIENAVSGQVILDNDDMRLIKLFVEQYKL